MNGTICACASEICAVMGCQRVAEIRRQAAQPAIDATPYRGKPVGAGDGCGTHIPRQLTEHDVRRIVREELDKRGQP